VVIDKAVRQWRPRLGACVRLRAHGGHLNTDFRCADILPFTRTHT